MTTPTPQPPYAGQPQPYAGQAPQPYAGQAQSYEMPAPQPYAGQAAQPYPGQAQPYERPAAQSSDGQAPQSYEMPAAQSYPEQTPRSYETPAPQSSAGPAQSHEQSAAAGPASAHRTGSPIIPPGIQPALLTVALAALTAGGALLGRPALAVAAVLLQAVTAAGWFRLNGMWPARQGIALAFLAGVVADAALLIAPAGRGPGVIMGTLGVWIPLIVVQQMRHGGSPDERLSSLTATSASTVLAVLAAGFLAQGGHPVVVGAVAVAVAVLVRAAPLPDPVSVVLAPALATAAGYGTAHAAGWPVSWTVVGAAAAVCAVVGLRVASYDWPSRFVHFTAGVALPLAMAAPVVWTSAWLLAK